MRGILKILFIIYKTVFSPVAAALGARCRFHPSCSTYALEAVERLPAHRALVLIAWRLMRCGPWSAGGVDPVPSGSLR